MTRETAAYALRALAVGLRPDPAGVATLVQLLEWSGHPEAEVLRDLLIEEGARVLLEDVAVRA